MGDAFDLAGRVAVITGGAGLLGVEHAAALLEGGALVVLADVREDAAKRAAATLERADAVTLDVTDPTSVQAALARVLERHGKVDILVNNAAIDAKVRADGSIAETGRLESFPLAEWDRQVAVGLNGAFLCAQAFSGHMASHGGGVILNIASDLSVIAPDQRLYRQAGVPDDRQPVKPVSYSVIKTALVGLTRYLAVYWAGAGVRVNALSPAGVYAGQPDEFVTRLTSL